MPVNQIDALLSLERRTAARRARSHRPARSGDRAWQHDQGGEGHRLQLQGCLGRGSGDNNLLPRPAFITRTGGKRAAPPKSPRKAASSSPLSAGSRTSSPASRARSPLKVSTISMISCSGASPSRSAPAMPSVHGGAVRRDPVDAVLTLRVSATNEFSPLSPAARPRICASRRDAASSRWSTPLSSLSRRPAHDQHEGRNTLRGRRRGGSTAPATARSSSTSATARS